MHLCQYRSITSMEFSKIVYLYNSYQNSSPLRQHMDKSSSALPACPLCHGAFSHSNLPRTVALPCQHLLCDSCLKTLVKDILEVPCVLRCPVEGNPISFTDCKTLSAFPVERTVLDQINKRVMISCNTQNPKTRKSDSASLSVKKSKGCFINAQKFDVEINLIQSNVSSKIMDSQNPSLQSLIISDSALSAAVLPLPSKKQLPVCLLHNKSFQVVCISDQLLICSTCALFEHSEHDLQTLSEFDKEKTSCCKKLRDVNHQSIEYRKQLSKETLEKTITQTLNSKLVQLKSQLEKSFQRIKQTVSFVEGKCIARLEEDIRKHSQNLKQSIVIPRQLIQNTCDWQNTLTEQLQLLQKAQLDQNIRQICNLKKEGSSLGSTFYTGNQLIEKLKKASIQLKAEVRKEADSLRLLFDGVQLEKKIYEVLTQDIVTSRNVKSLPSQRHASVLLKSPQNKQIAIDYHYGTSRASQSKPLRQNDATFGREQPSDMSALSSQQNFIQQKENIRFSLVENLSDQRWLTRSPPPLLRQKEPQDYSSPEIHTSRSRQSTTSCDSKRKTLSYSSALNSAKTVLAKLKIDTNTKSGEKCISVVMGLLKNQLQVLDLSGSDLEEDVLIGLFDMTRKCTQLKAIKLMRNKLSDQALQRILDIVNDSSSHICTVNLTHNSLTNKSLQTLLAQARNREIQHLQYVVLTRNKIKERQCKQTLEELRNLGITVFL